ncbi:hypothetical protein CEXT_142741 [Caerostris extrusa]|uniref:Uncharacterized protein n=1 Tax=Caerostris extrusa TaxID=172846 RepID=A0AAV4UJL4_CAEEX|nr:hypothetical protein CEXT_142741 [Caerostris extrusa]
MHRYIKSEFIFRYVFECQKDNAVPSKPFCRMLFNRLALFAAYNLLGDSGFSLKCVLIAAGGPLPFIHIAVINRRVMAHHLFPDNWLSLKNLNFAKGYLDLVSDVVKKSSLDSELKYTVLAHERFPGDT